jgi:putative Mg2+ transporter-C (MgtC) family protein
MSDELSLLLRLLVAAVLTAALGYERESAGKSAGLRTQMLVGVAAAMYAVLTIVLSNEYIGTQQGVRADPARAIQAVAMGIGFIGGGVIFVRQKEGHIHGLTTAASIWLDAAVGLAAGLGRYVLAVGATVLGLVILRVLERFDQPIKSEATSTDPG